MLGEMSALSEARCQEALFLVEACPETTPWPVLQGRGWKETSEFPRLLFVHHTGFRREGRTGIEAGTFQFADRRHERGGGRREQRWESRQVLGEEKGNRGKQTEDREDMVQSRDQRREVSIQMRGDCREDRRDWIENGDFMTQGSR